MRYLLKPLATLGPRCERERKYPATSGPDFSTPATEPRSERQRPYRAEYTGSLSNSAVNRRRARSVLNWGTVREHPWVLLAFCRGTVREHPWVLLAFLSQVLDVLFPAFSDADD